MESFASLILIVIVALVAWGIRYYINRQDLKSLPSPTERLRLLSQVREKRKQGRSYQECVQYLRQQGLRKGVAEGMMVDLESEAPPDMDNIRRLHWHDWTCEYPGNWKEQLADEELSRELAITLAGLGGSGISFYSHPDIDASEIISAQKSLLEQTTITDFYEWGSLQGKGVKLRGIQSTYRLPMEVMVFEVAHDSPLILMQITMIEEESAVALAFDLIESSFKRMKTPTT